MHWEIFDFKEFKYLIPSIGEGDSFSGGKAIAKTLHCPCVRPGLNLKGNMNSIKYINLYLVYIIPVCSFMHLIAFSNKSIFCLRLASFLCVHDFLFSRDFLWKWLISYHCRLVFRFWSKLFRIRADLIISRRIIFMCWLRFLIRFREWDSYLGH